MAVCVANRPLLKQPLEKFNGKLLILGIKNTSSGVKYRQKKELHFYPIDIYIIPNFLYRKRFVKSYQKKSKIKKNINLSPQNNLFIEFFSNIS